MNELMINLIKWFDDLPQPQLLVNVAGTSRASHYSEWAYGAWADDSEDGAAAGFGWPPKPDDLTEGAFLARFHVKQREFMNALKKKVALVCGAVGETNAWIVTRAMRTPRFQVLGDAMEYQKVKVRDPKSMTNAFIIFQTNRVGSL